MGISDRINGWVDDRRRVWGGALGNFLVGTIADSLKKSVGATAPTPSYVKDIIARYKERTGTPDDIRDFLGWLESMADTPIGWFFGTLIMMVQSLGIILGGSEPLANIIKYGQEFVLRTQQLDPMQAIAMWRRENNYVPPPLDDLRRQGWSEDRLDVLKELSRVIPGVQDLIRMSVREAFSPEIAEKFGQYQDPPTAVYPWAEKVGLSKEWVDRYWAAHWDLPSTTQGVEMLRRGVIDQPTLELLLRTLDVMPYWREKLIKISWEVPTRVDVRRFWEMRTIDEARLREIYTALGYHGRDLDDYVLWTKIYTDFPDLLARYKNGWITLEDVKGELIAMGMKPERAETLLQEKIKKAAPERVAAEKNLTKAEIVKGVKLNVISRAEGVELLEDMGYGPDEAAYIMAINLEVATGSPHSFAEFKDLTQGWRLAAGMEGKLMTEEVKAAGALVVKLTGEVAALRAAAAAEEKLLIPGPGLPATATEKLTELRATLHRAESELARVQTDYNVKVAEWKHAAK